MNPEQPKYRPSGALLAVRRAVRAAERRRARRARSRSAGGALRRQAASLLDHASCFLRSIVPDFSRALDLARHSAEFRETGSGPNRALSRAFLVERRRAAARSVRDRRILRRHRSPHRRPAGSVRARALAAARLVAHSAVGACGRAHRRRTRSAAARSRAQAPRGRIQHVLRRPSAEAALGDAQPRRGARQEVRSRRTSRTTATGSASRRCSRATPRSSISGIAVCARARRAAPDRSCTSAPTTGRSPSNPADKILHVASFSDPMHEDGQAARSLPLARRSAARDRRRRRCRSTSSRSW